MNRKELVAQIRAKRSFLCVGLDADLHKLPKHLLSDPDPVLAFNKAIIDATADVAVAYKPNLAFYESLGVRGWDSLQQTLDYIPAACFTIADAKRGDIGNTADMYARAFFKTYNFDSVTVNPYMGRDSVDPFLQYEGKWAIVLGLTSNAGAADFQLVIDAAGEPMYKQAIQKMADWGSADRMMYVVGATRPEALGEIRRMVPDHFFLVPGVGAQGGSLSEVFAHGANADVGLLVNASRSILYASNGHDFAEAARAEALRLQAEMASLMAG
ncbi:MAG: orotidine-5'-phosphate decarboxylase [Bacteroidia bacterium]